MSNAPPTTGALQGASSSVGPARSAPRAPPAPDLGIDLTLLNRGRTSMRPLPEDVRVLHADVRDADAVRAALGGRVRRRRQLRRVHARARAGGHRPVPGRAASTCSSARRRLPEARRGCRHRVHAAAQPDLAVLTGEDRLRGPAGARLPGGRLPGHDRSPVAHLRPHAVPSTRAGRRSSACGAASRSSYTATAPRCGRSPTSTTSPRPSSACSATRRRSATASTSPPTRC